ncbi:MAG: cupin domain-containing protein [Firmicutes bacterium]|nr:cupin domain-containing protein [Alicyclobacillaceae bacterium]MCL6496057.1 cupin domain-containing protein [Bacillota bacterium]
MATYDLAKSKALAEAVAPLNVTPLWLVLGGLITDTPEVPEVPYLWSWKALRPWLDEACRQIRAEEAERRVLTMTNPAHRHLAAVTHYLNAGLQIILPGEIAPTHRHAANAIRLILEGDGAYTVVNGEKTVMRRGDFVTTPIWSWHDHGNDSDRPVVWLDGLDFPFVHTANAMFKSEYPTAPGGIRRQPVERDGDDSFYRYGQGLRPSNSALTTPLYSPILNYRYTTARAALERLSRTDPPDPIEGWRLEYINPLTGGPVLPTMDAFLQLLPAGFEGQAHRHTHGSVYVALEGTGQTQAGNTVLAWEPNDVFVVPSWTPHRHRAATDAVLFSFTDAPIQRPFGLHREERVEEMLE